MQKHEFSGQDLICRLAVALLAARDSDTVCYERKKASENWEKL